jgi:hypothetical protein
MHGSFQGKKLGFMRYNGELESTVRFLALFSMTRGRIVPIVGLLRRARGTRRANSIR